MTKRPSIVPRIFSPATIVAVTLVTVAANGAAQHDHHVTQMSASDTSVSAPTTQSRLVADSGVVADSLLALCKPRVSKSIDEYSTCIGDGIGALSGTGNIALAMGTLDKVVHSDPSLILL